MKKTTLFKTIVLAAAMLGGASFADAQTTLYYRTLTGTEEGATQWSASDIGTGKWATVSNSPTVTYLDGEEVIGIKCAGKGEISNSTQIIPTANKMLIIDAVWVYGGSQYVTDAHFNIGSNITIKANPKGTAGSVIFNGEDTRSISNACSQSAGTRASDTWTIHAVINTVTNKVTALTVTGASASNTATFTLSGEVELTGSPTYNVFTTGQDYYKDAGNYGYVILKSLKVTEQEPYAYSVVWKSGDTEMGTFASGYDIYGASKSFPYYGYMCKDHVLYKNSTFVGNKAFTLTENPQTEYITGYTAQDVGYVVYCEEAENIDGMSKASTNAMGARCSGQQSAYCTEDVVITTLPAGTYNLTAGIQGNGTSTFIFKAGETTILTLENESSSYREEKSTGTFTIDATTEIKVNGGSSSVAFDNFYIVCTSGRVAAVDNLGYTFSSTLPLDFTGTTVEAYTAAYNSTNKTVTLNRVHKVPANTGLFIKGTAANIPVLTGDADVMGTNDLVAVSATTAVSQTDGDNTNFVLGVDNAAAPTAAVFLKAPTAGVSVGAGKAYLQIPTASAPATARMAVVFSDEATGISQIENGELRMEDSVYNLSGQRVAQPKKGLYIMNGKKVIVK